MQVTLNAVQATVQNVFSQISGSIEKAYETALISNGNVQPGDEALTAEEKFNKQILSGSLKYRILFMLFGADKCVLLILFHYCRYYCFNLYSILMNRWS